MLNAYSVYSDDYSLEFDLSRLLVKSIIVFFYHRKIINLLLLFTIQWKQDHEFVFPKQWERLWLQDTSLADMMDLSQIVIVTVHHCESISANYWFHTHNDTFGRIPMNLLD